jgi:hypothetical protein
MGILDCDAERLSERRPILRWRAVEMQAMRYI